MINARSAALLCCLLVGPTQGAFAKDVGKMQKALASALTREDATEARALIGRLGETKELKAAKAIVSAAASFPRLELYESALSALTGMDGQGVHAFFARSALKSKSWLKRYLLLHVCAAVESPETQQAVRDAGAQDAHPAILEALVPLLVEQRSKAGVDALITVLERAEARGHPDVVLAATSGLVELTASRIGPAKDWRSWWDQVAEGFDLSAVTKAAPKPGEMRSGVRGRIESRNEGKYLETITPMDVVVVKGQFDKVSQVLHQLDIPFTPVVRKDLDAFEFQPHQVVILNCHTRGPSQKVLKALEVFVAKGGYLFSSDWEMHNVLTKVFPKALTLKEQIPAHEGVSISAHPDAVGHPYLRDVFRSKSPYRTAASMKWKVDAASDLQTLQLRRGVVPLVFSSDLLQLHGVGVVALTFRFNGKVLPPQKRKKRRPTTGSSERVNEVPLAGGSVLHVLGHFVAQHDPKGDGFALQQLLGNFIVEKRKQLELRANRKRK
jgi:hypothetical protein